MKLLTPPKHLTGAIAPLIIVNYLMGLRVFEYPRGRPRPVFSLIYFLLLLGLYYGSLYEQHRQFLMIKLLKLEYLLYVLFIYVNTLVVTYEMLMGWCHTKRLGVCYRKISMIDETLRQFGSTISYSRMYYVTIGVMLAWFIFIIIISIWNFTLHAILMHNGLCPAIYLAVSYSYGITVNSIVIFEFLIFVRCLQTRFELVNGLLSEGAIALSAKRMRLDVSAKQDYAKIGQHGQVLSVKVLSLLDRQLQSRISGTEVQAPVTSRIRSHLPSQLRKQCQMELQSQSRSKTDSVIAECQKRKHLLRTIKQVHLELCGILKELCASFGVRISMEIGLSIMFITGVSYTLYARLVQEQNTLTNLIEHVSLMMTLTAAYILKVVFINHVCKNTAEEGNRTTEIIHTAYRCDADADIQEEIQQFSLQILQSPVVFSTFGLSLGYQVISSCLTAVTTYIVIMVQVSNSLESDNKGIKETRSN